ncbi:hypothetical protein Tco_1515910 [Tanacetum coccineum]
MASNDNDPDAEYALSRLLQRGTVAEYQKEFEILVSRVTGKSESLLASIYTFGLKLALIRVILWSNPTTLGEAFALARMAEAHREQNIKEKVDTTLSLPSEEASPVVKGPLDANEDTLLFLRSEDPNFKIRETGVKYVRALNVVPLKVVFTRPVDEASSVIEDVFYMDESNVEGMHVRDKFAVFFEDRGSMEKAAKVRRRKRVKCYVQGSERQKRKKVIRRGSGRRKVNQECFSRHHLEGKELAHAKSDANLSLSLLSFLKEQASAKSGALYYP